MRPHTSICVSSYLYIHVSSYLYTCVLIPEVLVVPDNLTDPLTCIRQHASAYVSMHGRSCRFRKAHDTGVARARMADDKYGTV